MVIRRQRDAEAELNLPPGFRFHPTDEELVVHYLCRKVAYQRPPVPIIAEVDLYKFNPWQLPDLALFGHREWYFFTPRDRKYPNGSRPNRAAGSGYWKATGADKPITPKGSNKPLGIKKALVFYSGKAPRGVKTDWIMHEYRMANANRSAIKKGILRLDDWVLCRLYNKKNAWEKAQEEEASFGETMDSVGDNGSDRFRTSESGIDNDVMLPESDGLNQLGAIPSQASSSRVLALGTHNRAGPPVTEQRQVNPHPDNEWFTELNLDDLPSTFAAPFVEATNQDYYLQSLLSSLPRSNQNGIPPTF